MTRLLKKICAILFPVAMLVPTGCSKEEVIDISRDLAVVVRVPADVDLGQRTPGDPGSASSQQIPRYLYFFTAYTPTEPSSAQSRRVSAFSLSNLSSDSWTPVENATGTVVNYLRTVILPMPATDESCSMSSLRTTPFPTCRPRWRACRAAQSSMRPTSGISCSRPGNLGAAQ